MNKGTILPWKIFIEGYRSDVVRLVCCCNGGDLSSEYQDQDLWTATWWEVAERRETYHAMYILSAQGPGNPAR